MKKLGSLLLYFQLILMVVVVTSGCNSHITVKDSKNSDSDTPKKIKEFTAFFAISGTELSEDNRIMNEIAKKVGAKVKMSWLTGKSAKESIGILIAGGEYPDFIEGTDATKDLINAGALIPIDEYWDDYPNIKNYLSQSDWNKVRSKDGHIYIIPQFGIVHGKNTEKDHNDEAFWIQLRVLEWAGYPKIKTLDQYFDLIERYMKANPTNEDGSKNIGYEILNDDWKYFCLENAPFFLDGYPNDGCCIVDPVTLKAKEYNTTKTAKRYFHKLNIEFKKGIIDPETFTATYDQYIAKLSTGNVLGICDQYWNFESAEVAMKQQGREECCYVPLGLVIDKEISEHYHNVPVLDVSDGISISISCKDKKGALQFINDLLSEDIQTMRYWGIEGVDYYVDKDGYFYRDEKQRKNQSDTNWLITNWCNYDYFPHYEGMSLDNKNAYKPSDQPEEYQKSLSEPMKKCLQAYGVKSQVELLNSAKENAAWYPMWTYSNTWTAETEYGAAKIKMDEIKHQYLPKVVMSEDFESAWKEYIHVFKKNVNIKAYEDELTKEIKRRVEVAKRK